jgi:hypothetical protein
MWVRFTTMTPEYRLMPCEARSTIIVCDRHREDAATKFFCERNLDVFADGLARERLSMPHPRSIEIEFEPIHGMVRSHGTENRPDDGRETSCRRT